MNEHDIEQYMHKKAEEIPIPPNVSPETMEQRLSEITPKKSRSFPSRGIMVAAAACLILFVGAATKSYLAPDTAPREETAANIPTATNETTPDTLGYDGAYEMIADYNKEAARDYEEDADASYEASGSSNDTVYSSGSPAKEKNTDYSDTDLQVEGVMEGDIVKTDGNYIYSLQDNSTGSKIEIYSVNGKDVTKVSDIELENGTTQEMYLAKNRLILIHTLWEGDNYEQTCDNSEDYSVTDTTEIVIYDTGNPQSPKKLRAQTQSGSYSTSRVADGYLYTFTTYCVNDDSIEKEKPETYIPLVNGRCIKNEDVRHISGATTNEYMVMTSLLLDGSASFTDSICSLGGAEVYYVSSKHIYSSKYMRRNGDFDEQYTVICKYSYTKGNFHFVAKRKVRGLIKDSYYLHEYKGNLCYVYTRYQASGASTNGIVTLDANLKKLGELENLGKNERIYSSYYMDNIAYFVTYRETDPVFAVDLSNPKKPELLSELKLPGFSSYLHSFGEGLLLGIGEQQADNKEDWDSCAKLSVFSIKDNQDIKELTKKLLRKHSADFYYSQTFASQNHKAVFVDEERKLIGFGIQYDSYTDDDNGFYEVYSYADNKLTKILSQRIISSYSQVRGIRIGDYFYVVDPEGSITVYDMPETGQTKPMVKVNS